jgi:hypothetical protein
MASGDEKLTRLMADALAGALAIYEQRRDEVNKLDVSAQGESWTMERENAAFLEMGRSLWRTRILLMARAWLASKSEDGK